MLLARHFAADLGRKIRHRAVGVAPSAQRALSAYAWPGNVRQLANAIEHALVLGDSEEIQLEDLPAEVAETNPSVETTFEAAMAAARARIVREALGAANGNVAQAAATLDIHVNSLRRMIRRLGLNVH